MLLAQFGILFCSACLLLLCALLTIIPIRLYLRSASRTKGPCRKKGLSRLLYLGRYHRQKRRRLRHLATYYQPHSTTTIFVQTPHNQSIVIRVPSEASLPMVAHLVAHKMAIPACHLRLVRRDRKLHSHAWQKGETVLLLFRLCGGVGATSSSQSSNCKTNGSHMRKKTWQGAQLQDAQTPMGGNPHPDSSEAQCKKSPIGAQVKEEPTEVITDDPGEHIGATWSSYERVIMHFGDMKRLGLSRQGGPSKGRVIWYCSLTGRLRQDKKSSAEVPLVSKRRSKSMRPEEEDELCDCGMIVVKRGNFWVLEYNNRVHNGHTRITSTVSAHLLRYTTLPDGFREQLAVHAFRATKAATIRQCLIKEYGECALSVDDIRKLVNSIRNKGKQSDTIRLISELNKLKEADARWVIKWQADDDGCLVRLFWMSPKQIELARKYWQVLFHDNTYNTNKYWMALSLFAGVNEHGKTVLLGQGLMEWNEPATAYEWIWQRRLDAVAVAPMALFTDAALAVLNSVPNVLPELTRHFLCLFHILVNLHKNCRSYFVRSDIESSDDATPSGGNMCQGNDADHEATPVGDDVGHGDKDCIDVDHEDTNVTYQTFLGDFCNVHRQVDPDVAAELWDSLLHTYAWASGLVAYLQKWLGGDRFKMWCLAFQTDVFTTGNKSTQRSEHLNNLSTMNLDKRSTLYFVYVTLSNCSNDQMECANLCDLETQARDFKVHVSRFVNIEPLLRGLLTNYSLTKVVKQMHLSVNYIVQEWPVDKVQDIQDDIPLEYFKRERIKTHQKGSKIDGERSDVPRKKSIHNFVQRHGFPHAGLKVFRVSISAMSLARVQSSLLPAPQFVVLYDIVLDDGQYTFASLWCTCGHACRYGYHCRHYFAVLHDKGEMVRFSTRDINHFWFRDAKPPAEAQVVHARRTLPGTAFPQVKPISVPPVRTVQFAEYSCLDNEIDDQDAAERAQERKYLSEFGHQLNAFYLWFRELDSSVRNDVARSFTEWESRTRAQQASSQTCTGALPLPPKDDRLATAAVPKFTDTSQPAKKRKNTQKQTPLKKKSQKQTNIKSKQCTKAELQQEVDRMRGLLNAGATLHNAPVGALSNQQERYMGHMQDAMHVLQTNINAIPMDPGQSVRASGLASTLPHSSMDQPFALKTAYVQQYTQLFDYLQQWERAQQAVGALHLPAQVQQRQQMVQQLQAL